MRGEGGWYEVEKGKGEDQNMNERREGKRWRRQQEEVRGGDLKNGEGAFK